MGRHTKHGGYRIDYRLVRTYVVPLGLDKFKVSASSLKGNLGSMLKETQLTPFVTKKILPLPFVYRAGKNNIPTNAHHYLRRWKRHNEMD